MRDLKQEMSLFVGILVLGAVEMSFSVELSMKKKIHCFPKRVHIFEVLEQLRAQCTYMR